MKSKTDGPHSLLIAIILGTIVMLSCSQEADEREDGLLLGIATLMNGPVVMKSTTYDLEDRIIGASEQQIFNMAAGKSQPDARSMYELYAGVEIQIDTSDFDINDPLNSLVKQTPLLAQFWALERMSSSVDPGPDDIWMTADDDIDPLLGYHETVRVGDGYRLIEYDDFGVTPRGRIDYVVEKNRKVASHSFSAGSDGIYETEDDVPVRTTLFHYNAAGKMERAEHYSGDGASFKSLYLFEYDGEGTLLSMKSYKNQEGTERLNFGSYSNLTWDESGERRSLEIQLGIQVKIFVWIPVNLMKFRFEFNDDGTIHKQIMYKPMSSTVDTCNVYIYSGGGLLGMAGMNDATENFSDDETTQVSFTINELTLGGG